MALGAGVAVARGGRGGREGGEGGGGGGGVVSGPGPVFKDLGQNLSWFPDLLLT